MVLKGGYLSTPISLCLSLFPSPDSPYHPFLSPPPCPPSTLHFYTSNTQCREIRMDRKKIKFTCNTLQTCFRLVQVVFYYWLYKYATFKTLMHLLTPGDVIPDMDFLGQKGYNLRMVYTYCSLVPKNRPVLIDGSDLACRIYCGCSFVTGYAGWGEVVIPLYPKVIKTWAQGISWDWLSESGQETADNIGPCLMRDHWGTTE